MATVALIAIAAILMFAFGGFQGITNIKQSLGGFIGFGLIGLIFAIGYSQTELLETGLEAAAAKKFQLTDDVRKFVGGSIWTGVALIGLATLGLVISEIRNFFK